MRWKAVVMPNQTVKGRVRISRGLEIMKNIAFVAAAALLVSGATAAQAGEGRVEVRGGVAFAGGGSEAVAGAAAGYDFDLGDTAFAGIEGSADKVLVGGTSVLWGVGGRLGAKLGDKTRAYVNGGIGFCCGDSAAYAGAGLQQKFGGKLYGKIEYRRYFGVVDINTAAVGVGISF